MDGIIIATNEVSSFPRPDLLTKVPDVNMQITNAAIMGN